MRAVGPVRRAHAQLRRTHACPPPVRHSPSPSIATRDARASPYCYWKRSIPLVLIFGRPYLLDLPVPASFRSSLPPASTSYLHDTPSPSPPCCVVLAPRLPDRWSASIISPALPAAVTSRRRVTPEGLLAPLLQSQDQEIAPRIASCTPYLPVKQAQNPETCLPVEAHGIHGSASTADLLASKTRLSTVAAAANRNSPNTNNLDCQWICSAC